MTVNANYIGTTQFIRVNLKFCLIDHLMQNNHKLGKFIFYHLSFTIETQGILLHVEWL